jgi:hypothetical protein
MQRTRLLGWLLCGAWGFFAVDVQHAWADTTPTPPSTTASYDHLTDEGVQAYESGRFAEARNIFKRAHELSPTARTLRTIGMCSFNLGDYVDAVWNLESSLTDKRRPLTEDQVKHVADLIARSNQRIGRFRLTLVPGEISLLVDGRVALLLARTELLLEAGHHDIQASAPGYVTAHSTLNVDGGDRTTLVFKLPPDEYAIQTPPDGRPASLSAAAALRDSQPGSPREPDHVSASRAIGYVSLGLGAAGLVGFGVSGALALSQKSELDQHCPNTSCSSAYQRDIERYDTLRTLSTVTLVGGGVLAALGATLLIFEPSSERAESAAIVPLIGLGSLGVRGQL